MSQLPEHEPEFDEVRSILKVCIHPEGDAAETPPDQVVSRPMAPGVQAVLAIDRGDWIGVVKPELVERWGKLIAELFELGLANVREGGKPQASLLRGSQIRAFSGENPFATTWVLMLDELFDQMPEHGGLVAMPQSHVLLFLPIVDVTVALAIGPLIALADGLFNKGPDSLTPNLYWWRGGSLMHLPGGVSERGVEFTPPDEFLDVLNRLASEVE